MTTNTSRIGSVNTKPCWQKENKLFVHFATPRSKIVKFQKEKSPSNLEDLSLAIPGLKHVLDSQKGIVFKFLWLIIISCSFCLCFYQIYNRFQFFLSDPINTRVTILRNESVKFPSLTVCAPPGRHIPLLPLEKIVAKKNNVPLCSLQRKDVLSEVNISSLWRMMSTEGLVGRNGLISRINLLNLQVTESVKNSTSLTTFGNCTTFFIKDSIPFQGEDCLASLVFNLPPAEIACRNADMTAMFFIHLDDEDVTYKFSRGYTILQSNSAMVIGLKAKQFRVINRTKSPCDSVRAVSHCERKCFEDFLKTQIPCRFPFMLHKDVPMCESDKSFSVLLDVYQSITSFRYKNCSCPSRCSEILYSKNLKHSSQNTAQFLQYYIEEDVVEDIEEFYSYTAIPFLCDVGGNLGLFLGLCIPTIIDTLQSITVFLSVKIYAVIINRR